MSKKKVLPASIKEKIELLQAKFNELYAIDKSYDLSGTIVYPGASEEEINQAEAKSGHTFPPSYKEFLRHCSGWDHFWGGYTALAGIYQPGTQKAHDEITKLVQHETQRLKERLGIEMTPAGIQAWQAKDPTNLYPADHLILGVSYSGELWLFDARTRDAAGEMQIRHWTLDYGLQEEPIWNNIGEFLDYWVPEVDYRLEVAEKRIKDKKAKKKKKR